MRKLTFATWSVNRFPSGRNSWRWFLSFFATFIAGCGGPTIGKPAIEDLPGLHSVNNVADPYTKGNLERVPDTSIQEIHGYVVGELMIEPGSVECDPPEISVPFIFPLLQPEYDADGKPKQENNDQHRENIDSATIATSPGDQPLRREYQQ